jgi:hypothetical protein
MAATGVVMPTAAMVTVMTTGMVMVVVVVMARPGFCVRSNQAERCRHSQNSTRHRYSFVWGRSRQCDPRRRQMEGQFMPERRGSNARNFLSAWSLVNQMLWLKCGAAPSQNAQEINGLTAILHG